MKTHEARRVHLPKFLRDELAAHLVDATHGPDSLVFTAARGGPIRESKWVPGYFKPAVRAAGLPEALRWYDLRHTAASLNAIRLAGFASANSLVSVVKSAQKGP